MPDTGPMIGVYSSYPLLTSPSPRFPEPSPDKRGYRKSEVLVRDLSGNPTNQELTPVIWVKRFSSGKVIGIYALAYRNDLLATG